MNNDLKKMYEKYVIKSFCENYNITKKELNDNSHFYFRFLCFLYLDFIKTLDFSLVLPGHNQILDRTAALKIIDRWQTVLGTHILHFYI